MTANQVDFTNLDTLDFAKSGGLIPAVVQHARRYAVLMVGHMTREALVATRARRRLHLPHGPPLVAARLRAKLKPQRA